MRHKKESNMCGFAGFIGKRELSDNPYLVLEKMGNAIRHRGPDDAGIWLDPLKRVGLVHRRLSIVDLSPAGHQPMVSESGRFIIVFNGEIYNHLELRDWLMAEEGGQKWEGHSDTESLIKCIEKFGLERTICRTVGMFAIALWDRATSSISLIRDRLGEKPLYYGRFGSTLVFGSELHAIERHPDFVPKISRSALSLFMRFGYVPTPHAIFDGIRKLPAGCMVTIPIDSLSNSTLPAETAYWSIEKNATEIGIQHIVDDDAVAIDRLEKLLGDAIRLQTIADVPLGAFLSGGVDSSLVVSLMQDYSGKPVNTYTIGFEEKEFDEAKAAAAVARHIGTNHHEIYLSAARALAVIPKIGDIYDEPFADPSQIPSRLISEVARCSVTVALSGDAGDEIFGGYNRYILAGAVWDKMSQVPYPVRQIAAGMLGLIQPPNLERIYSSLTRFMPIRWRVTQPTDKINKIIELLEIKRSTEIYSCLVTKWKSPQDVVLGGIELDNIANNLVEENGIPNFQEWMMLMDAKTFLPDDVLVKMDRAAMSVSLETRMPLLDHRVVEFGLKLPLHLKIRDGKGKWILREILYKRVPRALVERPKTGFAIPLSQWLRGPLRDWAETLMSETRLVSEGFLNAQVVRRRWEEHLSGRRDWQKQLWNVLMFQSWLEHRTYKISSNR